MAEKRADAPEYFWYQSLRVLFDAVGEYHPAYLFWAGIVGGSQSQSLINTAEFCALGEPYFTDWSIEELVAVGTSEQLDAWARRELFFQYCVIGT